MTLSQTEAPITMSQIAEIENYVALVFPKEYKEHLLKFNGGQCQPNVFTFNENGSITNSYIDWFLAIYDGEYDNLKKYIENYKINHQRLPSRILPIAHDPGGNLICISCDGEDMGSIYFWDHENEAGKENFTNLYLISKSFNDFINNLKEDFD